MSAPILGKVARDSQMKGRFRTRTFGRHSRRLWSIDWLTHLIVRWAAMSLHVRFLIASALIIGVAMAVLGFWIERSERANWTQILAERSALHVQSILAPHIQKLESSDDLPGTIREEIERLVMNRVLGQQVVAIKIWTLTGELVFGTQTASAHAKLNAAFIERIKAAVVVVDATELAITGPSYSDIKTKKLIESYFPLYGKSSNVIAIGELYEFSQQKNDIEQSFKFNIVAIFSIVAAIVIFLLNIMFRRASDLIGQQHLLLQANILRAAAMAKRNHKLKRAADRVRIDAVAANDSYLSSIGADIHDGPIQTLSLLMLKIADYGGKKAQPHSKDIERLIQQTITELRDLSGGLVLPEIERITFAEMIELAIVRHETLSRTSVIREINSLPDLAPHAHRVCTYRIIQEGLANAFKHADGNGQRVSINFKDRSLTIIVSDSGKVAAAVQPHSIKESRLGLHGLQARTKALHGTLLMVKLSGGGTELQAVIPLPAS